MHENHNTLLRGIKEVLNKWIDISVEESIVLRWQFFPN